MGIHAEGRILSFFSRYIHQLVFERKYRR